MSVEDEVRNVANKLEQATKKAEADIEAKAKGFYATHKQQVLIGAAVVVGLLLLWWLV